MCFKKCGAWFCFCFSMRHSSFETLSNQEQMTGIANTKSVSQSVISLCSTTQKINLGLTARDKAGSDPHIVRGASEQIIGWYCQSNAWLWRLWPGWPIGLISPKQYHLLMGWLSSISERLNCCTLSVPGR